MSGIQAHVPATRPHARRFSLFISGWAFRILFAVIISWLIVMAFFVTEVTSH